MNPRFQKKKANSKLRIYSDHQDQCETNSSFPFEVTPSGNLKVNPQQVVFETDKFSVLVADPCNTNISVEGFITNDNHRHIDKTLKPLISSAQTVKQTIPKLNFDTYFLNESIMENIAKPNSRSFGKMKNELSLREMGFAPIDVVNWETINMPTKTNLIDVLQKKICQRINTDIVVKIGNKEFKCHKLVLQSYSKYFERIDNERDVELSESKVSSKAFNLIYSWMIEQTVNCQQFLQRNNVLEVYTSAQYLEIKELVEQCMALIDSEDLFNEDTAFLLYSDARKKRNVSIMELMVPRIQRFFLTLVSSKDWLDLSFEEVVIFLLSNFICVHSEMEIFLSAVRWLMYKFEERKTHLVQVIECVRFGNMSPIQLVEIRRNQESPEILAITQDPTVQKMIDDGLSYAVFKDQNQNMDEEDYRQLSTSLRLEEPEPRNWAGQDRSYKSYNEFLQVLDVYRKAGTEDYDWSRNDSYDILSKL